MDQNEMLAEMGNREKNSTSMQVDRAGGSLRGDIKQTEQEMLTDQTQG